MSPQALVKLHAEREHQQFYKDIVSGLTRQQKRIPSKYLYDQRGSQLFDAICETPEYYVTRTELAIMQEYGPAMAARIGNRSMLIEYGSGSSLKTRMLLDHLQMPAAYVPVDISGDHLLETAGRLQDAYPEIEILPVSADFTKPFEIPVSNIEVEKRVVYFPGSTLGNFQPEEAVALLSNVRQMIDRRGGLLIGIDLQKDSLVLHDAYNDAEGVTRDFTLNLLLRMQRELGARLDYDGFEHHAVYNQRLGRIEIAIESLVEQEIAIGNHVFSLEAGELIRTEYSYKYTIGGFREMAREAGLLLRRYWTDDREYFAVLYLTP